MSLLPYGKKSLNEWIQVFESTLLFLGTTLLVSGSILLGFYFWSDFTRFTKLGILGLSNVFPFLFTVFFRKNTVFYEIGLTSLFFLVGFTLLMFGQIYQTEGNLTYLFSFWVFFSLLLVPFSRSGVVCGLWMVLLSSTVYLYSIHITKDNENQNPFVFLSLFFGILGVFLEEQKTNFYSEKAKSFLSVFSLIFTLLFVNLTNIRLFRIHTEFSTSPSLTYVFFQFLFPLLVYGFFYIYYRWFRFRILNLSFILLLGLGQILLKAADLFGIWVYSSAVSYLQFGLLVTMYMVWAVSHLNRLPKTNETGEPTS